MAAQRAGGRNDPGRSPDRWHAAPWPVEVVPSASPEEAAQALRDAARLLAEPFLRWVAETRGGPGVPPPAATGEVAAP